jgi:hypothetical protein
MTTQDGSATTAPSVEKNYEERKTNSKNCCSGFTGHFVGGFCIVLFMVVVDCDSLVVAGRCLRYCAYRRAVMGVDGIGVWTMTPEEQQMLEEVNHKVDVLVTAMSDWYLDRTKEEE